MARESGAGEDSIRVWRCECTGSPMRSPPITPASSSTSIGMNLSSSSAAQRRFISNTETSPPNPAGDVSYTLAVHQVVWQLRTLSGEPLEPVHRPRLHHHRASAAAAATMTLLRGRPLRPCLSGRA